MITVRADGVPLHALGSVGDLVYSTNHRGSLAATWSMGLPRGYAHPALRPGASVDLMAGAARVWGGRMAEPDRGEWTFTADGHHMNGGGFSGQDKGLLALAKVTGSYVPSTVLDTIVDTAAADFGLGWTRNGISLRATPLSADSEAEAQFNLIGTVFEKYKELTGREWMVDPYGVVSTYDLPTTPRWALRPGLPAMATADEFVTHVFVRYFSEVTGTGEPATPRLTAPAIDQPAADRWQPRHQGSDQTTLGYLDDTAGEPQAIAQAVLDAQRARPAYTEGLELSAYQISDLGGVSPALWQVHAGQRVRQHGVLDQDGAFALGATPEWVIGTTIHDVPNRTLTVVPIDPPPRTAVDVAAETALARVRDFQ